MVEPQVGVVNEATMNGCTRLPKALQQSWAQAQDLAAATTLGTGALQVASRLASSGTDAPVSMPYDSMQRRACSHQ